MSKFRPLETHTVSSHVSVDTVSIFKERSMSHMFGETTYSPLL